MRPKCGNVMSKSLQLSIHPNATAVVERRAAGTRKAFQQGITYAGKCVKEVQDPFTQKMNGELKDLVHIVFWPQRAIKSMTNFSWFGFSSNCWFVPFPNCYWWPEREIATVPCISSWCITWRHGEKADPYIPGNSWHRGSHPADTLYCSSVQSFKAPKLLPWERLHT